MSVTITLNDELAQRLGQQAHARKVSLEEWTLLVLSRAPEHPDQPDAWRELNVRRFEMIRKRHQRGLTESEEAELAELQAAADRWLEPIDRQRLEALAPFEELAQRLAGESDG